MKSYMRSFFLVATMSLALPLAGQGSAPTLPRSIAGYWQEGSPETSDARLNCYRFFSNGKFSFELSQYDETKRILSLHGTYRIKNGVLFLVITHRIELHGGSVVWNPQARNGWSIDGGKSVKVIQANSQEEEVSIEACPPIGKRTGIKIGGDKYYQLSVNPNAQ
ncbi:hypothetical protein [Geothrix rubra]|uniref:hypothetical protein n=1 Tax=Geothrix rubra TaxID=2927977 RepID=UPI0025529B86|nr:hypothetical protein [Geothrix rubra]